MRQPRCLQIPRLAGSSIERGSVETMEIAQISIRNFKALKEVDVPASRFVCLIGENNAGKSSMLQALQLFIEPKKPQSDFYYDPQEPITISIRFDDVSKADLDLISDAEHRGRIEGILHNATLTLVRRFEPDGTNRLRWVERVPAEERFSQTAIDGLLKGQKAGLSFVKTVTSVFPELTGQLDSKTTQTKARELINGLSANIPDEQKKDVEAEIPTGFDNTIRPLLPEVIYIPAVKDLSDDVKTKDSASFGKLLGILLGEIAPQLQNAENTFKDLREKLNRVENEDGKPIDKRLDAVKEIESAVENYVRENFHAVSLDIRIPPPEIKTVLSSAQIWANDGVLQEINSKGDGLKRAVTFSILRTYVEFKRRRHGASAAKSNGSPGYLFLFEEPELYLHPTAQRILFDALGEISKSNHVIVSTHSPLFFGPDMTGTFIKLAKANGTEEGTTPYSRALPISLSSVNEKTKFQLTTYETSATAFFCDSVILVEGDSDFIALSHLAKIINNNWDANRLGLAFCRISGKGSISRFREFFKAFAIRVCVLGDLDCLVDGFQHLGVPDDCAEMRNQLLVAVDDYIGKNEVQGRLSSSDFKEIAESPTRREQYQRMLEIYERCLQKQAALEDFRAAGNVFFDTEQRRKRRAVLEEDPDPVVSAAKDNVIEALREHDVYLLRRGPIEAYYPDDVQGSDKVSKAMDFCSRIRTKEEALGLCDLVPIDNGSAPEFEVIFSNIFGPRHESA